METVILVLHLIIAVGLIGVVLLQRSEGGALGIGSGGGGGSLFSARGVGNTLTRTTAYLALGFFITSIALTMLANKHGGGSIFDLAPATQTQQPAGQPAPAGDTSVLPQLPAAPAAPAAPATP